MTSAMTTAAAAGAAAVMAALMALTVGRTHEETRLVEVPGSIPGTWTYERRAVLVDDDGMVVREVRK